MHSRLLCLVWMWPFFAHPAASFAGNGPGSDPALSITNTQGEFVLSWPLQATDWVLEEAANVQPLTFWRWVSPRTYESNAVSRYVRLSAPAASAFYRLRKTESGQTMVDLASTNCGGTLDLTAPVPPMNGVWTKLDVTYNGGIATIYADGRKLQAGNGAIRGTRSPLVVGAVPGAPNFQGVIDDLKIYNRERDAVEIGPVATTMWETAWINNATNIHLQGFGPAGRPLTYAILPLITPTNGTVSRSPGSSIVTYQAAGGKGPDAFAYTVSDGEFTSAPAIVTVSVVKPHWLSLEGAGESTNGSSPGQAWRAGSANALDAIWKTNNYYDCFSMRQACTKPGARNLGRAARRIPGASTSAQVPPDPIKRSFGSSTLGRALRRDSSSPLSTGTRF